MKTVRLFAIILSLFHFSGSFAQNYSDGIGSLMEVKFASEDIARAIQSEWSHDTKQYNEARNKYNSVKRSIDQMIAAFDANIKSGKKIADTDIKYYVRMATANCESLANHYNIHSHAGGTNALFGLDKLVPMLVIIFEGVTAAIDSVQDYQIQKRLNTMHKALDPCKLVAWDDI